MVSDEGEFSMGPDTFPHSNKASLIKRGACMHAWSFARVVSQKRYHCTCRPRESFWRKLRVGLII